MATRQDLLDWVLEALQNKGGKGKIVDIAKFIWDHHQRELSDSGNLFFTWQYDMRWAAKRLRDQNLLADADSTPRGVWALYEG